MVSSWIVLSMRGVSVTVATEALSDYCNALVLGGDGVASCIPAHAGTGVVGPAVAGAPRIMAVGAHIAVDDASALVREMEERGKDAARSIVGWDKAPTDTSTLVGDSSVDVSAEASAANDQALADQAQADREEREERLARPLPIIGVSKDAPDVAPGAVDDAARLRVKLDRATLEAAGIKTADAVYAEGSRVNETGVENARKSRETWKRLPLVGDAMARLAAKVQAEERTDLEVRTEVWKGPRVGGTYGARVCMDNTGAVRIEGREQGYAISPGAMAQLIRVIGPEGGKGGSGYLMACDPALRAINVNRLLGSVKQAETLVMRTRGPSVAHKGPQVFGVVTDKYHAMDVDRVASVIGKAIGDTGMRAAVTYDGYKMRVEATAHSDVAPEKYSAGETFKVGVTIKTDDTGRGGLHVHAIAVRNLCLNLIILDECSTPVARVTHMSSPEQIAKALARGVEKARDMVAPFLARWSIAMDINEVDRLGKRGMSVEEAIPGFYRALFARKDMDRLLPVGAGKALEGVMKAWSVEPGTSRASLVNGLTRWAHERDDADAFALEDMAAVANKVLWAPTDRALPWAAKDEG
jgi:hypothetical protein